MGVMEIIIQYIGRGPHNRKSWEPLVDSVTRKLYHPPNTVLLKCLMNDHNSYPKMT